MTVPVPGSLVYTYSADDSTTSFSYPVRFLDKAEIVVILREGLTDTVQVLGTDYTISGSSWPTGGSIVFGTAPASGKTVVIYRNTVAKQLVDLENTQRNDANAVETQLDRLAMVQQDQGRLVGTAIQPGSAGSVPTDGDDGNVLIRDPSVPGGSKWVHVTPGLGDVIAANNLADLDDKAVARNNLGLKGGATLDAPSDPDLSTDTDKLALRGDVDANLVLQFAADDTALKGMDISIRKAIFGLSNQGWWLSTTDDVSAEITAGDPRYQPTLDDATGASGGWYRAGSIATGQKEESAGARYYRLADMIRVGSEAVKHNGRLESNGGKGGFLWDRPLNFDAKTADFTVGATLTSSSGGAAVVSSITDLGTGAGTLWLRAVTGTFADNDTITDDGGGSATANGAVATKSLAWVEAQTIIAASGKSSAGPIALTGAMEGPGLGVIAVARHNSSANLAAASQAWAGYDDATRYIPLGTTWARESEIGTALVSPATDYYNAYGHKAAATSGAGTTIGHMIGSGADPTVNPLRFDADVAVTLTGNGAKFWAGYVAENGALKRDGGTSGRGHAYLMAYDHAIEWGEYTTNGLGFSIASQITDSTHKQELRASNAGLSLLDSAGTTLVRLGWVASAANGLALQPTPALGSPSLAFIGSDTNGGVSILGKGTGGGFLKDGAGASKFAWTTTGVGFFGTTPVAKQSITGALSTVADAAAKAVLTSIISALSTPGLVTNSTT